MSIHQTSLAFLTFPTAIHNRFDHSVGVATIAKDMIRELSLPIEGEFDHTKTVIAAALMHDIGHGPFSHLSEEAYEILPDLFEGVIYGDDPLYPNAKPHEAIGALLLRTPYAEAYFDAFNAQYGFDLDPVIIGDIITGNGLEGALHYSQIVNGSFDADKIDYLHRDAYFSGVPISVDLHRFLYSIEIGRTPTSGERVLAMTERGAIPAEQIIFGKATMFQAVYHHQKVRASDCLFKGVIERLMTSAATISGIELRNPAHFIELTDNDFMTRLVRTDDDRAKTMLQRLADRRLPVRALELDRRSVGYAPEDEDPQTSDNLWSLLPGALRERFAQYSTVKDLREEIRERVLASTGEPLLGEVWLDVPFLPNLGQAPLTVQSRDGSPEFLSTFPSEQWADVYKTHRYRAHLFVPAEVRAEARTAAIDVINEAFSTQLAQAV